MLTRFASIGRSVLISSLILRRNYDEYKTVEHLDEEASGCFACPHFLTGEGCTACDRKKYRTEVVRVRVNEKHRYGNRMPLKKHALNLLLHLHFLNPDSAGLIRRFDADEAAEKLDCARRTVINNLMLLQDRGYISVSRVPIPGRYQVFINGYSDYFLPANRGGRGFVRIPAEFAEMLPKLPDINAIRLALRSYIDSADLENKPTTDKEKSIRSIKQDLPEYVTKKKLGNFLDNRIFRSLFDVSVGKKTAVITARPRFSPSAAVQSIKEECRSSVTDLIQTLTERTKGMVHQPVMKLTDQEMTDISNIALRLPIHAVTEAVTHFYETYIQPGLPYRNAGAIIRAYANDIFSQEAVAAL